MNDDDNDGQMMFGDLVGLKLPDICLTGEGKTPKNLTQETCPGRGSNPDPLRDRHACYRLAHRGGRCASEKRNVEEVRQKIKISNHSATRLVQNLAATNQSNCLLSIAMKTMLSCQTGTLESRWRGDYFVMARSPLTPQPPATIRTGRPPFHLATYKSDCQRSSLAGRTITEVFRDFPQSYGKC